MLMILLVSIKLDNTIANDIIGKINGIKRIFLSVFPFDKSIFLNAFNKNHAATPSVVPTATILNAVAILIYDTLDKKIT